MSACAASAFQGCIGNLRGSVCHASHRAAPPHRAPPLQVPQQQQQRLACGAHRSRAPLSFALSWHKNGMSHGGRRACSGVRVRSHGSSSASGDDGWADNSEQPSPVPPASLAAATPPLPAHLAATAPAASPAESSAPAVPPTLVAPATARAAVPPALAGKPRTSGEVRQQQAAGEAGKARPGEEAAEEGRARRAEREQVDWNKAWYAVGVIADMDASRPHALTVVGRPLVLWRDASRTWRCFLDQCPHRLVPLSEGRIDSEGRLACSYHGWAFAGSGACQLIPQAPQDNPGQPPRALSSPRACATAFPTRDFHGILFVWPDSASVEEAERTAIPEPEGVDWSAFDVALYARRLPYSYEMLAENFADPSHLYYAHHGIGPLHRDQGAPMKEISMQRVTKEGFQGTFHDASSPATFTFSAPTFICYNRTLAPPPAAAKAAVAGAAPPAPTTVLICLYMTPMRPGECLMIFLQANNEGVVKGTKEGGSADGKGVEKRAVPRRKSLWGEQFASQAWRSHLFTHNVFDSDNYFLHCQDILVGQKIESIAARHRGAAIARAGGGGLTEQEQEEVERAAERASSRFWQSEYFLPAPADLFVVAFRQWMGSYAGGAVSFPPGYSLPPQPLPKAVVLGRMASHTAHCTSCSSALASLQRAHLLLPALSLLAAAAAGAVPLAFPSASVVFSLVLLLMSAALAVAAWKVHLLIPQFIYVGWDHSKT
ncbi:unnamed protein product [Closterium sp. NIES-65]|nr:unnamed protein product [Closterium sp. NIES-65]